MLVLQQVCPKGVCYLKTKHIDKVKKVAPKFYTYETGLKILRKSVYYGFWLRLKKLGFSLKFCKINYRTKDNVVYLQTYWLFFNKTTQEKVTLMASRFYYTLSIKTDGKIAVLTDSTCYSKLEYPLLRYFNQLDKPLFIPRMGKVSETVRLWRNKWRKHVANDGKWSNKIARLGRTVNWIFSSLLISV